jgi:hypothetical protein
MHIHALCCLQICWTSCWKRVQALYDLQKKKHRTFKEFPQQVMWLESGKQSTLDVAINAAARE